MKFRERQELISGQFDPTIPYNRIGGTGVHIHYLPFESVKGKETIESFSLAKMREAVPGTEADGMVAQNNRFVYPVFMPEGRVEKKAILLLHGLNERKWDKYLAWAHYLAENTRKPVILFPTSFHMNRSMPDWLNPRYLNDLVVCRRQKYSSEPGLSTYVNLALSERLTETPERFFLSGLQTIIDLRFLLHQMKTGEHPLFDEGTRADIFAYSIGGLIAQVMLISNPDGLLDQSRLFLFCAGSLFGQMNGISRVIIDPVANERIQHYYKHELEEKINRSGVFGEFFNSSPIGMAFRSMITPERFRKIREKVFRKSAGQIFAISLKKDRVIPPDMISSTLMGQGNKLPENMDVYDFNYPYSHEMPFPFKGRDTGDLVDEAFEMIFRKAAVFLS